MRQNIIWTAGILFLWLAVSCQSENTEINYDKNNVILKALGSVTIKNIYRTVEELQNFETRYSWEKQGEVADYLFRKFQLQENNKSIL